MSQSDLEDQIEISFPNDAQGTFASQVYQGTGLESPRLKAKKKVKKEKNYDEFNLGSLLQKQDQLLIAVRRQIADPQEFQSVIQNEIKVVDKQEMIKEFGSIDKKKPAPAPVAAAYGQENSVPKAADANKESSSPNFELVKQEARKEYFMKRLRNNIDKLTRLTQEWKMIRKRREQESKEYEDNEDPSLPSIDQNGYAFEAPQNLDPKFDIKIGRNIVKKISMSELKSYNENTHQSLSPPRKNNSLMDVYKFNQQQFPNVQPDRSTRNMHNYGTASTKRQRIPQVKKATQLLTSVQGIHRHFNGDLSRGSIPGDLIVNSEPEIPLRVALSKQDFSKKTLELKKRNWDRVSRIQQNQETLVEQQRLVNIAKAKKQKENQKKVAQVEKEQKQLFEHQAMERAKKQELAQKNHYLKNRQIERQGYQDYKKHIKEVLLSKDKHNLSVEISRNNSKHFGKGKTQDQQLQLLKPETGTQSQRSISHAGQDLGRNFSYKQNGTGFEKRNSSSIDNVNYLRRNHETLDPIETSLGHLNARLERSTLAYDQNMQMKIYEKKLYNTRVDQIKLKTLQNRNIPMTSSVSRYNLPEDAELREMMAKNILDYSIAKKINKHISEAHILNKHNISAMKEKNDKKLEDWHRKANEQRKLNERVRRQIVKKHTHDDQKLVIIENQKQEDVAQKKETAHMKKMDQQMNLEEQQRLRQKKMIKLQTKHFGTDYRSVVRKVSMDLAISSKMMPY